MAATLRYGFSKPQLLKWPDHSPPHRKDFCGNRRESGELPGSIHLPLNPKDLPPHGRVWLKGELVELQGEIID